MCKSQAREGQQKKEAMKRKNPEPSSTTRDDAWAPPPPTTTNMIVSPPVRKNVIAPYSLIFTPQNLCPAVYDDRYQSSGGFEIDSSSKFTVGGILEETN